MRTLQDLLAADDTWAEVAQQAARAGAEILEPTPGAGEVTLVAAQVTTRSPMGAIALHSGALLIDHGWLRILGAGGPRIGGGLVAWNEDLGGRPLDPPIDHALVVAYDALGGFFAVIGGRWPGAPGTVYYLPPDEWQWDDLEVGYSGLLRWAFSEVGRFYEGLRWPGWQNEVGSLGPDEALTVYPFLGFETTPIGDRHRAPVPARELWTLLHQLGRDAGDLGDGTSLEVKVKDQSMRFAGWRRSTVGCRLCMLAYRAAWNVQVQHV